MRSVVDLTKGAPHLVLLVVQLAGVLLDPFMESTYAGRAAFSLFGLLAIPAVFTLLAWAFACLFVVVQALDPHGFNPGGGGTRSWMELLLLSFTTPSSTGLSDVTPISGHARSVVMLEQVAGVFYIAMVVTRLVSLRSQRSAARAALTEPGRYDRPHPR